ncbi:hypothetical protein RRF68_08990 [Tenacibaculum sp. HL-MS23]|uniref:hypothetical protein n=1 Tax=Tenacibaculum sp. HL-MS23 TaxID=3077734 RepID=UPI0028FC1670|nr:hypothetical protein [Tenacibaculum sp. HL-MS23]WNW01130.1 hypothetical protein RRF68_08990 [Tenacibaculum sp. HL-MS23]
MENKNLEEVAMTLSPDTDNPKTGGGNDTGGIGSGGTGGTGGGGTGGQGGDGK